MSNDYEVGYGKPPKHGQFKKGQSGNPKGRPKGSRNFTTDVKNALKEPVCITKGGKRKTVSTQLASILRLREKALSGDARALDRMIDLARNYNDEDIPGSVAELSQDDAEILKAHTDRVLRQAESPRSDESSKGRNGVSADTNQMTDNDPAEVDDEDAWLR